MLKVVRGTLLHISFASNHSSLVAGGRGRYGGVGNSNTGIAPAVRGKESCGSEEAVNTEIGSHSFEEEHRNDHRNCYRNYGRDRDSIICDNRSSEMPTGADTDKYDDNYNDDDGVCDRDRDNLMQDLISISRESVRSRTALRRVRIDREDGEGIGSKDERIPSHSKCDTDGTSLKKQKLLIQTPNGPLVSCAVEREKKREAEREREEDCAVRVEYKEARFVIGHKR
jgi:hypothetical protein